MSHPKYTKLEIETLCRTGMFEWLEVYTHNGGDPTVTHHYDYKKVDGHYRFVLRERVPSQWDSVDPRVVAGWDWGYTTMVCKNGILMYTVFSAWWPLGGECRAFVRRFHPKETPLLEYNGEAFW